MKSVPALIIASMATFAVTNIDDAVLLTLFFARRVPTRNVVFGQCLGFVAIVSLSLAGLWAAVSIPSGWFRFLGLLPLAVGSHVGKRRRQHRGVRALLRHQSRACMGDFAGLCGAVAALVLGWKMAGKPPTCFALCRPVRTLHRAARVRGSWDLHSDGEMNSKKAAWSRNKNDFCPNQMR